MIDYTKIEISDVNNGKYLVIDEPGGRVILEVVRTFRRRTRGVPSAGIPDHDEAVFVISDVRTDERITLKTIPERAFNKSHLSEIILTIMENLVCIVCHEEWGPVCESCAEDAGDQLFLTYKKLQRLG